ncbi:hypothetical protein KBZ21_39360, partial [Streptomyces sp. A73]|nr:hypothetical protein [Streptomyces sp. A73]
MRPAAKVALFLSGLLLVLVPGLASGLQAAAEEPKPMAKQKAGFDGWSLRIALAATIGLTASGEFALA